MNTYFYLIAAFLDFYKTKETFRKNYIKPAIELGLIKMTLPEKPNSKNQRYVKQ